jgi:hypothetical protein
MRLALTLMFICVTAGLLEEARLQLARLRYFPARCCVLAAAAPTAAAIALWVAR